MDELIGLISEAGQQEPIHVRPRKDGGFEIISGHRRHFALSQIEGATAKVLIRDDLANDYDAIIAMVDLNAKADLKPSELAKAVELRMEAVERKRGRPHEKDVHGEHDLPKGSARKQVAEDMGLTESTVQRLAQVKNLHPELTKMLDKGELALEQASQLSKLKPEEQKKVHTFMEANEIVKPSQNQAGKLKILSEEGVLSEEKIKEVLKPKMEKPSDRKVTFDNRELNELFAPSMTPLEIKRIMWEATVIHVKERQAKERKREKLEKAK